MRGMLLVFSFALMLGCGGAFQDVHERDTGRTIAVYRDPEGGQRLVLIAEIHMDLRDKLNLDLSAYRDATEEEMTNNEQDWAIRKLITGGRCHICGEILPPLTQERASKFWACKVRYAYQDLAPMTPDLDIKTRVDAAVRNVAIRYPTLAAFEDQKWLSFNIAYEIHLEELRKTPEQYYSPSEDPDTPATPPEPVLAPKGAAGI